MASTATSADPMQRVEDLLQQMTLEEKAMQVRHVHRHRGDAHRERRGARVPVDHNRRPAGQKLIASTQWAA
ncbi:MAG TPA: hypothetical protein VJU79_04895 [Candidatus Dormibacteraeota bacterium]|nr:hypothetical protein [Candidatus Dormibacteraeota bacterium]